LHESSWPPSPFVGQLDGELVGSRPQPLSIELALERADALFGRALDGAWVKLRFNGKPENCRSIEHLAHLAQDVAFAQEKNASAGKNDASTGKPYRLT